jgi:hypothetical protein
MATRICKTDKERDEALRAGDRAVTISAGKTVMERHGRPRVVFDPKVRRPARPIGEDRKHEVAPSTDAERSAKE